MTAARCVSRLLEAVHLVGPVPDRLRAASVPSRVAGQEWIQNADLRFKLGGPFADATMHLTMHEVNAVGQLMVSQADFACFVAREIEEWRLAITIVGGLLIGDIALRIAGV